MPIVTLTTDLGYRDPYLAIVKACLLQKVNNVQIIDLSCDIKDNNISDAAYSVGFDTASWFTQCFKEEFGKTPTEFMTQQTS